jgi:hypothetical protein
VPLQKVQHIQKGDFVPEQAEPQPACQGVLFQHHQHPLGGNAARQFVPADVVVVFPERGKVTLRGIADHGSIPPVFCVWCFDYTTPPPGLAVEGPVLFSKTLL